MNSAFGMLRIVKVGSLEVVRSFEHGVANLPALRSWFVFQNYKRARGRDEIMRFRRDQNGEGCRRRRTPEFAAASIQGQFSKILRQPRGRHDPKHVRVVVPT